MGKEYEEIDLSGLEKLTIRDAIDTQLELFGVEVAASVLCETTTAFARTMAAKATGLPIESRRICIGADQQRRSPGIA